MIGNEQTKEEQITPEEVMDNEDNGVEILKRNLSETSMILEEAKRVRSSDVYLLMEDELNSMYQTAFTEAYSTDDAYKAKFALERMKGIGSTMKVLDNLIARLEDDANNIGNEILEMEK